MKSKIKAEDSRYHGDKGWSVDHSLFSEVAVTRSQWIGTSGDHLYAAQILLNIVESQQAKLDEIMKERKSVTLPPMMTSIFFFHCAISIENAFKGVIIGSNSESIKDKTLEKNEIPKSVLGHDLVKLAKKSEFPVDIDVEYVLSFLTRYGIWSGKYPTPIKSNDSAMTVQLSDGNHYLVGGYNPRAVPSFLEFSNEVYKWAKEKLQTIPKPEDDKLAKK